MKRFYTILFAVLLTSGLQAQSFETAANAVKNMGVSIMVTASTAIRLARRWGVALRH